MKEISSKTAKMDSILYSCLSEVSQISTTLQTPQSARNYPRYYPQDWKGSPPSPIRISEAAKLIV